MNRFYHLVIFALVAVLFVSAPAFASAAYYPDGLNGPSSIEHGLYPASDSTGCCWMGKNAAFHVAVPHGVNALVLTFFVPDYAAPKRGQSLRIAVGNAPAVVRCCFAAGLHQVAVAVPAHHGTDILVHVEAGSTFVPARVGLNGDTRELSVLLRGVSLRQAQGALRQAQDDEDGAHNFEGGAQTFEGGAGTLALLLLLGIAITVATWKRPVWGIAALVLTDPFLLAYGVHGTTVTLPKVALLAVAAGLVLRPARDRFGLPVTALGILLGAQVLFAASMALSSVHAVVSHGAALRETLKAWEYAATLLVAYFAYRRDPQELVVRWALSGIVLVVSAAALLQVFTGAPQGEMIAGHAFARIAGPLEGPNQLAGFLGVLVPAVLAFALFRPPLQIEWAALALGELACLLTFSRGGIAALALGIALVLLLRYAPRFKGVTLTAAGAALALALAVSIGVFSGALHGSAASVFGGNGDSFNGGLGSRTDLWHGAYQMWRTHPLLGVGPGNYELLIGNYDPGVRTHANSMYFNVLAEQGIVGFGALLLLVAASIAVFVRRRLTEPFAVAGCAIAFVLALHQVVDSMWIYPKVGVIWWLLIGLAAARVDAADPVSAST